MTEYLKIQYMSLIYICVVGSTVSIHSVVLALKNCELNQFSGMIRFEISNPHVYILSQNRGAI